MQRPARQQEPAQQSRGPHWQQSAEQIALLGQLSLLGSSEKGHRACGQREPEQETQVQGAKEWGVAGAKAPTPTAEMCNCYFFLN